MKAISPICKALPLVLLWRLAIAMFIYSLSRVIFYMYNVDLLQFAETDNILTALKGGLVFDLSGLLYVNLLVIVLHLLPIPCKYSPKYQSISTFIYWLCNIPAFIFNLGDTVYYRFTGQRTSLAVFDEFANENPLHFLRFFIDYWGITFTGIGLISLWVWLYKRYHPATEKPLTGKSYYLAGTLTILLSSPFIIAGIRGGFSATIRPIAPNHAFKYIDRPEQRAMVLNTPFNIIRLIDKTLMPSFTYPDQELDSTYTPVRNSPGGSAWSGQFEGRNVVVLIWESFAREWVGELNKHIPNYKGFTPFIDSLIQQSYVFANAYATGGKSIDAMPAIFASIPRPGIAFVSSHYSGNHLDGLPKALHKRGYDTRFYHNAPTGSMGFDAMARHLGFASYRGMEDFGNDDEFDGTWGIFDEPFLQYVANDIDQLKEPFLASEFTTTSHSPFRIPEKYHNRFPEGQHPQHRCIRYTDYALEQFFRTAKTKPWYERTLFVLVADHAVSGHLEEYKNSVGAFAIPIILFDPQGKLQGRDEYTPVSQTDISQTLMDLLGVKEEVVNFGRNMFAEEGEHFAIQSLDGVYQMIRGDYALQFDGQRVVALYNIKQDPALSRDIQREASEVLDEMLPLFKSFLQDFSYRLRNNKTSITQEDKIN